VNPADADLGGVSQLAAIRKIFGAAVPAAARGCGGQARPRGAGWRAWGCFAVAELD